MKALILLVALALGGCTATPLGGSVPAPAPQGAYLAVGTEPGWTLEITPDRLNYSGNYGAVRIDEPHGGADARTDGRSYTSPRLAVTIRPGPCSDGMSDRRYAEKVIVVAEKKTVSGCGGAILPPANLAGTLWRFTHIGDAAVADESRTELRFADGTLSGSAGCNRFTGPYTALDADARTQASLNVGSLAMTRMACVGSAATQEAALMALFGGPLVVSFEASGAMVLTAANGNSARLINRP